MAHLATVNNLLIAVGGAPHFDRPNLPLELSRGATALSVKLDPGAAEKLHRRLVAAVQLLSGEANVVG